MLSALSVRNIILIDQLDVGLDSGLTALTGETGAGKSILLDALGLALGGRGDAASGLAVLILGSSPTLRSSSSDSLYHELDG